MNTLPTLRDCEFIPPAQWQVHDQPDHILLTQSADPLACRIQILAPQPSSGDLEQDAKAVFATMYSGWQPTRAGEQLYTLSRGVLSHGLEYCMMEGQMSATSAAGRYVLEDGVALVIGAGQRIVIVAARHGGLLAHNDCLNKYETWRRFFNSLTVKGTTPPARNKPELTRRIVGVWSQAEGRAASEYVFAANGRYAYAGGIGSSFTTTDLNYEYLHLKTNTFEGNGDYTIAGDVLTLTNRTGEPEQARLRFEQVNRGGTGWKERLWLLKQDRSGQVEVPYDKKDR